MKYKTLKNGLSILYHHMPNTHSVTMGLYIKAGAGYGETEGIAHFLEHLHFRRMGNLSQRELYYEMECLGSTLRAKTYRDFMCFWMKVIPEKHKECLNLFVKLFEDNQCTKEEFEKEKQVVINQILEKGDFVSIEEETRNVIFKDHDLSRSIMGNPETIELLDQKHMQEYKRRVFFPENMLFCVTGNVREDAFENVRDILEKIPVSEPGEVRKIEIPKCFYSRKPDISFLEIDDNAPLDLNISFDAAYDCETKILLTILNCILGEGVGSRLQKIIREEKCYASDIASYIEWYQNFAVLHIRCSVDKDNFTDCLADIVDILKKMKSTINKQDLDVSLPFYTSNRIFFGG